MCGIVGYVGGRACRDLIVQGLERLEYRGYDSAGFALQNGSGFATVRAVGNLAKLRGLNIVGMKRSGLPRTEIHAARRAYRAVFDTRRPIQENLALAAVEFAAFPTAMKIVDFLKSRDKRYFLVPATDEADDQADEAA